MKLLNLIAFSLLYSATAYLISACSPHPGAGVWKSNTDNEMGIERLVVGFDGKAEFISNKSEKITWHCFWSKLTAKQLNLTCTPSSRPSQKQSFILITINSDKAKLLLSNQSNNEYKQVATFKRLDENPSPGK